MEAGNWVFGASSAVPEQELPVEGFVESQDAVLAEVYDVAEDAEEVRTEDAHA